MIHKEADNKYPINSFSKARWSPRAFADRPVGKEKLQSIFEAARWSASGGNQQPWRFIVGIRPDNTWTSILATLEESNAVWAAAAPVLMITCAKRTLNSGSGSNPSHQYDLGQSVAHLSVEATNLGLHVHQMGGFFPDKAIETFGIPEDFKPMTAVAIGYIGDPETLDEKLKRRELEARTRKEFDEFVFSGKFGEALKIF
jgi:nitroreductase